MTSVAGFVADVNFTFSLNNLGIDEHPDITASTKLR
jgi:hypothetical protein